MKVMIKVAVASSNGENIDCPFGKTENFYLFEISENGDITASGKISGHTGGHDPQALAKFECMNYLLALKTGPHMQRLLEQLGITIFDISGSIESALKKIYDYQSRRQKNNQSDQSEHIRKNYVQ